MGPRRGSAAQRAYIEVADGGSINIVRFSANEDIPGGGVGSDIPGSESGRMEVRLV